MMIDEWRALDAGWQTNDVKLQIASSNQQASFIMLTSNERKELQAQLPEVAHIHKVDFKAEDKTQTDGSHSRNTNKARKLSRRCQLHLQELEGVQQGRI